MASNETSKYKLSVVEGTELQLSVNTGVQGPAGPQGETGLAGPNEITTSTSTNLTGFISGNGTAISGATAGASTPTADTIVLRNTSGGINANHIRLHGSTYYSQINPASVGQAANTSFNLPTTGGTIATNNTAVMLINSQTVAGAKTFSGQMELTGQALTNDTSALTRGLGDSRYFPSFCYFLPITVSASSVSLVTAAELTLNKGFYYFEAYAATYVPAGTPANATIRLSSSNNAAVYFYGSDDFGNTPLSHIDVEEDALPSAFIRQSSGTANTFSRRLTGIIRIGLDGIALVLEFRQSTTSENAINCRKGAFMIARKVGTVP